jgi:NAD(P)-dependent dehydrogenase (short-subunit alcohol dehydrogenase family)
VYAVVARLFKAAPARIEGNLESRRRQSDYAESKLYDAMLAFAIARRWPGVFSNALEPGWVPTKMGGSGAPDDIDQAHLTQAWLAALGSSPANVTGQYFYHLKPDGAERASPGSGTARPPHRNLFRDLGRAAAGLTRP